MIHTAIRLSRNQTTVVGYIRIPRYYQTKVLVVADGGTGDRAGGAERQSLDLTAHAAWLWSQNPEHFTIQLLGSHNLDALRSFMQKHKLEKQASFYRTLRDGKEWFVLLHGSYTERAKAKAAIEKLPADIRKTQPWARRFLDIHGELSSQ